MSRACCTLLGPEGPGRTFWCVWFLVGPFPSSLEWMVVGYRPYIENYTVDASILDSPVYPVDHKDLFIDHWSILSPLGEAKRFNLM